MRNPGIRETRNLKGKFLISWIPYFLDSLEILHALMSICRYQGVYS
jgi:hypothetical protein